MAFYVLFMFCLAVRMFRTRLNAIKAKEVPMNYFKAYGDASLPERVMVMGRHYDNQFQVPVLFLITCAAHLALNQATHVTLILAWAFVISRLAHSWVHLGSNNVRHRVLAFGAGWLLLLCMWIQIVFSSFIPTV